MHSHWCTASHTLYTTLSGWQDAPIPVYFACDMRSYTQFHKSGLPCGLRSCRISPPHFIADCCKMWLIRLVLWIIEGLIVTYFFQRCYIYLSNLIGKKLMSLFPKLQYFFSLLLPTFNQFSWGWYSLNVLKVPPNPNHQTIYKLVMQSQIMCLAVIKQQRWNNNRVTILDVSSQHLQFTLH